MTRSSVMILPEESQIGSLDGRDQRRPIQILISPLAGGFWQEGTGMARRPVQLVAVANEMVRAQRVRRASAHLVQRTPNVPTELVRFAECAKPTQRAFAISGCRVNQHPGHWVAVCGILRVDSFGDGGTGVAALNGQLANQGVSEGVQQDI